MLTRKPPPPPHHRTQLDVNGASAHELYRWLKAEAPPAAGVHGDSLRWNFSESSSFLSFGGLMDGKPFLEKKKKKT